MQEAAVVLGVLRERGRKGLPLTQLYRQMFNKDLYLLAYGNIYSNHGAMTPGAGGETADGMSEDTIDQIIGLMRYERYRFAPARRIYIPKKNGKLRPLGLPPWPDKQCPCFRDIRPVQAQILLNSAWSLNWRPLSDHTGWCDVDHAKSA